MYSVSRFDWYKKGRSGHTLDELKDELYTMFNQARSTVDKSYAANPYSDPETSAATAAAIDAAARVAQCILATEHEIANRQERSSGLKSPGKPDQDTLQKAREEARELIINPNINRF